MMSFRLSVLQFISALQRFLLVSPPRLSSYHDWLLQTFSSKPSKSNFSNSSGLKCLNQSTSKNSKPLLKVQMMTLFFKPKNPYCKVGHAYKMTDIRKFFPPNHVSASPNTSCGHQLTGTYLLRTHLTV